MHMIIKINISYNNTLVIKIQTHIQHNRKKLEVLYIL